MILTEKTEVLGEKHYTAWVVDEWMSMEQWWNDIDRGKLKSWEKILSHYHVVLHKSNTIWPEIEPGPPGLKIITYHTYMYLPRSKHTPSLL